MTTLQPRKIVHRGRVEASGFLIDAELIEVREARRRILDLWAPGVQIYANGLHYYVRLLAPLRVDCAESPGTPLVLAGNVLAALPLAPDELSELDAPSGSVVYASGGVASVATLHSLILESPESWLDISAFKTVEVSSLGHIYQEPRVVNEPEPFHAREKLDGAPAATPELLETIAALKTGKNSNGKEEKTKGGGVGILPSSVGVRGLMTGLLGSLAGSIASLVGRLASTQNPGSRNINSQGSGKRKAGAPSSQEANAGADRERVSGILRRFALRLLHTTRLAGVLGRRQAAYMARMMDMFERGDLDDALKHAIPLNDLPPTLLQSPALGVPTPRTSLAIVPQRNRHALAIGAGDDVLSYLRQLYRASFDRLVAQRRIEEAAFVLAELLRDNEEAVAFLERHGKLKLAAELAEARDLPAGLVVRQWFLAGEVERAVGIARRTQAFADAVIRLEKTDRKKAEKLRLVWAESLSEAGNYAAAVDVIWPVMDERYRARGWMDRAIEIGGPLAARMLARKLSLVPEEFEDVRRRALVFLEDESFEQRDARLLFAETLCQGERTTGAQTVARAAARAILRDAGQACYPMQLKQFRSLVDFSGDGALRTDVPPFPTIQPQQPREPLRMECSSMDCGSTSIADAALLGDGRILVAIGEAGVRLLTRDGRTVTHFDQPAHRLVLSEHGDRAIALARRGEVWRLAHLDLLALRAKDWCEAHIDAFATDYDGSLWFIGAKGDFYVIDANAKEFDALWRVPDAGKSVVSVARPSSTCSFLTTGSDGLETWIYRLPLLTLRSRTPASILPGNVSCVNLQAASSADGVFVDQSLYCHATKRPVSSSRQINSTTDEHSIVLTPLPVLQLRLFENDVVKQEFAIGDGDAQPGQPEILGNLAVSPVYEEEGARVRVIDLQELRVTAELFLRRATQVSTRLGERSLTVADNCGRLLVLDLSRNCLVRNLRV